MSILSGPVVCVGDSITVGGGTTPYPNIIATDLSITVHNLGVGGAGWDHDQNGSTGAAGSLINRAAAEVDTPYVGNNPQPFLVLFAGTNDLVYGYTGAQTYAAFQTYLAARLSALWTPRNHIIVCTTISRSNISNAERVIYNNLLINGALSDGYLVAHLEADARIGAANSYANPIYFGDVSVHPTTAGNQVIAGIIEAVSYALRRLVKVGS